MVHCNDDRLSIRRSLISELSKRYTPTTGVHVTVLLSSPLAATVEQLAHSEICIQQSQTTAG